MRRRCPVTRSAKWHISPAVRRAVTAFSNGSLDDGALKGSRGEIDGLLREINSLRVRRGRGEQKLCVSASKLRLRPTAVVENRGDDQLRPPPASPSGGECSPSVPVMMIKDPPTFTDIACTLRELEDELFQLGAVGAAVRETTENTGSGVLDAEEEHNSCVDVSTTLCGDSVDVRQKSLNSLVLESAVASSGVEVVNHHEGFVCWSEAEAKVLTSGISDSGTVLHVSVLCDRTFIVELREQPCSARAIVTALNRALTEVESLEELSVGLVVVFRSAPGIDFFTPRHSELEMGFISRVELLRSKERLFCRMRKAALAGVVFRAELNGPAFDIGAELFFMCEGSMSLSPCSFDLIRVGFPSVSLGVWPAPCVLQHMCGVVGNTREVMVATFMMHKFTLRDLMKKYPNLLGVDRNLKSIMGKARQLALRRWKKLHMFLGWDTKLCVGECSGDVFISWWNEYCALICAADDDMSAVAAAQGLNFYLTLLETREFRNVASVTRALRCMQHRVLYPPPQKDIIEIWLADNSSVNVGKYFPVFLGGFSHATVRFIAEQRSLSWTSFARSALLIGELEVVREAVELLDCAVVATPLRPERLRTLGEGDIVEVQLIESPRISSGERKEALSTSLAYLHSKGIPYVVTRGDTGNRLVAALSLELCKLATMADVKLIELVARELLGFRISPFQLLDHYGSAHLTLVINRYSHLMTENQVGSTICLLLSAINMEYSGGSSGINNRGGFYDQGGCFNPDVVAAFSGRVRVTRSDILVRLLAALVNECCCMLLDGCVETVDDVNLISIGALTLSPSTGGILSYLDDHMGCLTLLQSMEYMSRELGIASPPSPLLRAMVEAGETFYTLSKETLFCAGRKA